MRSKFTARGLMLSALVLLLFSCAPPKEGFASPRTVKGAKQSLAQGDLDGLIANLGKDDGFARRASRLAETLDQRAWLVAVGAPGREYHVDEAAACMKLGDDEGLREALGFGDQNLRDDILNAGHSVGWRKADGRKYYRHEPQPIDLLDDVELPELPSGALALHVVLYGRVKGHEFRLSYGLDREGMTDLRAQRELAFTDVSHTSHRRRIDVAEGAVQAGLEISFLADGRWYAARFQVVLNDGALVRFELARDDKLVWRITSEYHALNE